jgi:hypothetical protein
MMRRCSAMDCLHAGRIGDRNWLALRFSHLIADGVVERAHHGVAAGGCDDAVKLQIRFDIGKQVLVGPAIFHALGASSID